MPIGRPCGRRRSGHPRTPRTAPALAVGSGMPASSAAAFGRSVTGSKASNPTHSPDSPLSVLKTNTGPRAAAPMVTATGRPNSGSGPPAPVGRGQVVPSEQTSFGLDDDQVVAAGGEQDLVAGRRDEVRQACRQDVVDRQPTQRGQTEDEVSAAAPTATSSTGRAAPGPRLGPPAAAGWCRGWIRATAATSGGLGSPSTRRRTAWVASWPAPSRRPRMTTGSASAQSGGTAQVTLPSAATASPVGRKPAGPGRRPASP